MHSSTDDVDDQDLLVSGFLRVLEKVGHLVLQFVCFFFF